jgi:uncharacterized protein (DUF2237 family)
MAARLSVAKNTWSAHGDVTGWTRSGSCNWDPSDSGYHEVCVTMSSRFLDNSARHDANDLTSVVSEGGHWCICAWAFAVRACPLRPFLHTPNSLSERSG